MEEHISSFEFLCHNGRIR